MGKIGSFFVPSLLRVLHIVVSHLATILLQLSRKAIACQAKDSSGRDVYMSLWRFPFLDERRFFCTGRDFVPSDILYNESVTVSGGMVWWPPKVSC
jgi:hypothetical protein